MTASGEGRSQPGKPGSQAVGDWEGSWAPEHQFLCVPWRCCCDPRGGVRDARHAWVVPSCLLCEDLGVGRDLLLSPTSGPLSDKLSAHWARRAYCTGAGRGPALPLCLRPSSPPSSPTCLRPESPVCSRSSFPSGGSQFTYVGCSATLLPPSSLSQLSPSGTYFS